MLQFLTTAAQAAKPAGGAETFEIVAATAGAGIATVALLTVGILHRQGKITFLQRMAEQASRVSGLPPWAALPADLATISLMGALFGMYWDISLHIDQGRDAGPLANPAHYFILFGLFGIFAAGFLATVLPKERPSRAAVKLAEGWYAPVGGLLMLFTASFALVGFPLDDMWHRLFGQDVTLWGPTHLMLIGGAGLTLLGQAALYVEGGRQAKKPDLPNSRAMRFVRFMHRTRYAGVFGGLLIGLSTFQGEFDFGVPQFELVFHPILIAFAAGAALVGARIYAGPGGAVVAVVYFLVIRGVVSLLVGPVLGEVTPHFPIWIAEALVIELIARRMPADRPYRFGAVAGLGVAASVLTVEWAWSHLWMPMPWSESLLPEALIVTPLAGVAGGLIGGFLGTSLAAPRRPGPVRVPSLAPAAAGVAIMAALIAYGLDTETNTGVRGTVQLSDAGTGGGREADATVTLDPPDAADDAHWLSAIAWQGGKLRVDQLEKVRDGVYRTTEPLPVDGDWKTGIRLHTGDSLTLLPIYLPEDSAIPAKGVPATPRIEREFVADHEVLQRERKDGVASGLPVAAYGIVLLIAIALIAALGWALRRLAGAEGRPPRDDRPGTGAAARAAPA